MLEAVLSYLNNWFVNAIYNDTFTIKDKKLTVTFLTDGQYFRIIGSLLNDGLYEYTDKLELKDETFDGTIWALAVPNTIITLSEEIQKWQDRYGETASGPYSSESFGGYSYTKASDSSGASAWISAFKDRLAPYRKAQETACIQSGNAHRDPGYRRPFNPDYPWRNA